MSDPTAAPDASLAIARLEARVAALEEALAVRSRELRRLQGELPLRDLVGLSRMLAGLSPNPINPYDPEQWRETTELTGAEVEETLTDLWRTLEATGGGRR